MKKKVSVFVCNCVGMICERLTEIVNGINGYSVVGDFTSGKELVSKVASSYPDMCILDVRLKDLDGFAVIKVIREINPSIRLLVLSEYTHPYTVGYMVKYGIHGYLSLDATVEEITGAIVDVTNGFHYSTEASSELFNSIRNGSIKVIDVTERQQLFIQYCYLGYPYRKIAKLMGITIHTLEYYRDTLQRNHGLINRNDFVLFGVQTGLINIFRCKT